MHYRARAYSPRQMRFLQNDPPVGRRAEHQYAYVSNNPVSQSDPSGNDDRMRIHMEGAPGYWVRHCGEEGGGAYIMDGYRHWKMLMEEEARRVRLAAIPERHRTVEDEFALSAWRRLWGPIPSMARGAFQYLDLLRYGSPDEQAHFVVETIKRSIPVYGDYLRRRDEVEKLGRVFQGDVETAHEVADDITAGVWFLVPEACGPRAQAPPVRPKSQPKIRFRSQPYDEGVFNFETAPQRGSSVGGASRLKPGPFAGDSIPARGPGRDFTPAERAGIDAIGARTGCHSCGARTPGTKGGHFVPDHQPPNQLNPTGAPQRLYPHCKHCSLVQGGEIRASQLQSSGSTPQPPPQSP